MLQATCPMNGREFYSSLIRPHILHHAVQEPIFGWVLLKNWLVMAMNLFEE